MNTNYFGIDVSRHQGNLDWSVIGKHKPDVWFAGIRSNVSWAYEDDQFVKNWKESAEVGDIARGAYHVLYPGESIVDQVGSFYATVKYANIDMGELPPIADIEVHHGRDPNFMAVTIEDYLLEIENVFDRKPIIYSAAWFFDSYVSPSFMAEIGNKYWWWVAHYRYDTTQPFDPRLPKGLNRDNVIIHQYNDRGKAIGGSGSSMDYNWWVNTEEVFGTVVNWDNEPPPVPVSLEEKVERLWNRHPELW